jgi:phospholipid/cholesterol/gamma-HCH transport system permease protein
MIKLLVNPVGQLGKKLIQLMDSFGKFTRYIIQVFNWMFRPPFRPHLFTEQMYFIGNKSIFIVALTGSFTGMVMCYQTYYGFKMISADSIVGPIVALSMAKELAPTLTGLIVSGRAGAAMAAQIGTMKVTEQIDALEVMGINGYHYLGIPRIIAGTLTLPLLSSIFLFVGNVGSWVIGTKVLGIDASIYFSKISTFMFVEDILQGIIKSFFFGFIIALVGSYCGFSVKGGAEGVGKGTNKAVVWAMILVLVTDFILTSILVKIL